jgi:hypothetical protein
LQDPVILLGLGFTTSRLAWRLLGDVPPRRIYAAVRNPSRFAALEEAGVRVQEIQPDRFPADAVLVNTVPPVPEPDASHLRDFILAVRPKRVLYISSTGVYGEQRLIDGQTPVAPADEKGLLRVDEEAWTTSGPWTSLILRAAAIYGPGRGVHVRLREGKLPRGTGAEVVSRIHVDDLVSLLQAGIPSSLEGAFPAADEYPCSSAEIVSWCRDLLGVGDLITDKTFPVSGRRVDARGTFEALGLQPKYPSFQKGIPASLDEEGWPVSTNQG